MSGESPRRIEGDAVAMPLDIAAAGAEPVRAVGRHLRIGDDALRRRDDEIAQRPARPGLGEKHDADTEVIDETGKIAQRRFGHRLVEIAAAIGVAQRYRLEQKIARRGARIHRDMGGDEGLVRRRIGQLARNGADIGRVAVDDRGVDEIFDRGAEPQMHFAPEGIEGTEIARAVGIDGDRLVVRFEQPGLGVVRVGGEDGGGERTLDPVDDAALPAVPGRIGRPPTPANTPRSQMR